MKLQNEIKRLVIFVSHILSDLGLKTRWGIMELEFYAFVYRAKHLGPYLLGKLFKVRIDHKSLVYLSNSSIKLVRWRVILLWTNLHQNNSILLIFRKEKGLKKPKSHEEDDSGEEELDEYCITERHEVFARYHNSIVGHLDVEHTLMKAMSLGGLLGLGCFKTFHI